MKNFFKFIPQNEPKVFEIEKAESSPVMSKEKPISSKLQDTVKMLSELLHYPKSNDVQFRFFDITIDSQKLHAFLVYYDGLADSNAISDFILEQFAKEIHTHTQSVIKSPLKKNEEEIKNLISGSLIAESALSFASTYEKIIDAILHGDTALLVDSLNTAFICDVKKIPGRPVSKAENEMNLKGPSEAFIEGFRTNTALIRKYVKDENLIFETAEVGSKSKTRCSICYISTITNDSIVSEVRRRINSLKIDYLIDSGQLEQLIEDRTFLVSPLILSTERPDKVASHLIEGRVAIIVEGSSNVLIVPSIYSDFTQSSEDSYVRFPYSILLRVFRIPATFFSIFLPGLYISICDFHQEMIPSDLLFTIARYT